MDERRQKEIRTQRSGSSYNGKKSLSKSSYFTLVVFAIVICFSAGLGGGFAAVELSKSMNSVDRSSLEDGNVISSTDERDIANVAKNVGPSVVSIITTGQRQSLFGDQVEQGAGSGIVISDNGWIMTNKHVVDGSTFVTVIMSDGTTHDRVRVVGEDPLNDIAFLKISGVKNLKAAKLGDSSSVQVGQRVIAIGNSLGEFQNTVTSGIISGKGRPIVAGGSRGGKVESLTDLLQTDAAINPGNSGGPLLNMSGQVIGVNTAIAEDAQSVGFAIPINAAKGVIKHIEKTGKIARGYLGVSYITITPDVAKDYDLSVKSGAYVFDERGSAITSGSPADKAGIKEGDIIVKVGDLKVGEKGSLASLVSEYATGDRVELLILRDGKEMRVTAKLTTYGN